MAHSSTSEPTASDPRTIVTPDAFSVKEELLGFPLASPSRRLAAMTVDGILILILTQLPGFLLGLVAAVLFFRMATRRGTAQDALTRAFRWSMGCFGSVILVVTLTVVWFLFFQADGSRGGAPAAVEEAAEAGGGFLDGLTDLAGLAATPRRFRRAESHAEAVEAGAELARRAMELAESGSQDDVLSPSDVEDLLRELAPADPPWDEDEVVADVLARLRSGAGDEASAGTVAAETDLGPPVATLTEDQALAEYQALRARREAGDSLSEAGAERLGALRSRLGAQLAADTLEELADRIEDAEDDRESMRRRLARTEATLEAERDRGFLDFLLSLADELGLTFGWGSVYLTIFLTWWKGQTPGKRLLNVRVLRLDGEPITWFVAFERAGGYAAGVATGLLGFAQIYWDPNRQAIHDKIVGTVVIRDGLDKVPGPWMAESE